jgi:hypothetical protein
MKKDKEKRPANLTPIQVLALAVEDNYLRTHNYEKKLAIINNNLLKRIKTAIKAVTENGEKFIHFKYFAYMPINLLPDLFYNKVSGNCFFNTNDDKIFYIEMLSNKALAQLGHYLRCENYVVTDVANNQDITSFINTDLKLAIDNATCLRDDYIISLSNIFTILKAKLLSLTEAGYEIGFDKGYISKGYCRVTVISNPMPKYLYLHNAESSVGEAIEFDSDLFKKLQTALVKGNPHICERKGSSNLF